MFWADLVDDSGWSSEEQNAKNENSKDQVLGEIKDSIEVGTMGHTCHILSFYPYAKGLFEGRFK